MGKNLNDTNDFDDVEAVDGVDRQGYWNLRRARVAFETRSRLGFGRVRLAVLPVAEAAIAAGVAYYAAQKLLGHELPFFAAVAVWMCLGFTVDRPVRRVAEVAFGVAMGVALGDVFVQLFGTGVIQVVVVLFISALVARFIDRGAVIVAQAGVQSIVVVGMPALAAAPFSRVADALLGGVVALIAAALLPGDPRRRARAQARSAVGEVVVLFETLARGLASADLETVDDALVRARGTQPALDEWSTTVGSAKQATRISPSARFQRGHKDEVARLARASMCVDRAIRSLRVFARRSGVVVEEGLALPQLAVALDQFAVATRGLGDALGSGVDPSKTRAVFDGALELLGEVDIEENPAAGTLVDILHSVAVDLLKATGLSYHEARIHLRRR